MQKNFLNPSDALSFFWDAPITAVFDQNVIALVTARSISSLQRARWAGSRAIVLIKKLANGMIEIFLKTGVINGLKLRIDT